MELTDRDRKMVAWLRRQDAAWKSTRIITLAGSAFAVLWAVSVFIKGKEPIAAIALFGLASYGLSYTLGSWSGRPEIALLLKLIDHQDKR
jgi:hypothetical protein